jgi:hypothetical protein
MKYSRTPFYAAIKISTTHFPPRDTKVKAEKTVQFPFRWVTGLN